MNIVLANKKKYTFADAVGTDFRTVVKDWKSIDGLIKDFTEENVNECTIDGTAKKLHFDRVSATYDKDGSIVVTVRCSEFTDVELLAIENKAIKEESRAIKEKNEALKSELEEIQIALAELVENGVSATNSNGVITDGSDDTMPEHRDFGDE